MWRRPEHSNSENSSIHLRGLPSHTTMWCSVAACKEVSDEGQTTTRPLQKQVKEKSFYHLSEQLLFCMFCPMSYSSTWYVNSADLTGCITKSVVWCNFIKHLLKIRNTKYSIYCSLFNDLVKTYKLLDNIKEISRMTHVFKLVHGLSGVKATVLSHVKHYFHGLGHHIFLINSVISPEIIKATHKDSESPSPLKQPTQQPNVPLYLLNIHAHKKSPSSLVNM